MSTSTLVRAPNVARNNGRQPAQRGAEKNHCRDPNACGLQTGTNKQAVLLDWEKGLLLADVRV